MNPNFALIARLQIHFLGPIDDNEAITTVRYGTTFTTKDVYGFGVSFTHNPFVKVYVNFVDSDSGATHEIITGIDGNDLAENASLDDKTHFATLTQQAVAERVGKSHGKRENVCPALDTVY